MVNNSKSTVYYRLLTLCKNFGKFYQPEPNTTLNEKFDIYPNIPIGEKYPIINYIGIGIGGSDVVYDIMKSSETLCTNVPLLKQVPFLIIEKNRDLTISERKNYRLRKEVVINNIEYVEYYLKVINSISDPQVFKVIKTGEQSTRLEPFNFNISSILNPEPLIKEDFLAVDTNTYIAVAANVTLSLTPTELRNIRDAIDIKYGANTPKILTETGIFTGVEYTTVNGTEALAVQPAFFQAMQYDLQNMINSDEVLLKDIQIGGIEVLR